MFIRGLKTKIALNLAILLLTAMILIDLVMMFTAKRDLLTAEISRGELLASMLEETVLNSALWENADSQTPSKAKIIGLLDAGDVSCALVLNKKKQRLYFGRRQCTVQNQLLQLARASLSTSRPRVSFRGSAWGVFWRESRYMVLSAPVFKNNAVVAATSIVLPLEALYKRLRRSQQILGIYMAINVAILTFIGIYRLSKAYFQPLSRLAQKADDYKEDDEMIFSVRREDNELNRLSKALNSMLKRISTDREKLRATVMSLEKANSKLKKAQKEIVRAEKLASVGRLSAGIAHEIGNPIGIVIGYLDLIKAPDISADERHEYILRTEKEIDRINTIIRQLLEISRPSKAGIQTVAAHELIGDIAQVVKVQPLMAEVDLELDLAAQTDTVLADPNKLRQVFLNLIINAADAISSTDRQTGGKLKIISELEADAGLNPESGRSVLKIMFIDNGPGIPAENLDNIFDPFFTTKAPGKGTGLGLSVSFMIVESFNGRMTVESEPGKGTNMIIQLPLCRNDMENPERLN